jgi:hypothetical protein
VRGVVVDADSNQERGTTMKRIMLKQIIIRLLHTMVLVCIISLLFSGCTSSKFGKLEKSAEATKMFKDYRTLPNHKYYYRGAYDRPTALVAINDDYTLDSNLWSEIDPNGPDFKKLVDKLIGDPGVDSGFGSIIYDHTGNKVKIWYSPLHYATVEIDPNNRIVLLAPKPIISSGAIPE